LEWTEGDRLRHYKFVAGCQPDVVVEPVVPEIEQFFLTGEGETVEFKERLDVNGLKLPKTATAFANTKGGTIVFGMFVNNVVLHGECSSPD
jgi:hypothetical protein